MLCAISKTDASGTTQFAWDFENRLTQAVTPASGSASYKYDALGRRVQRAPSAGASTNFIYDGQDVVKDTNSDGTTVEYLNGPGIDNKIRQKGSSSSTTYYFAQDHLGSTTALTGTTGKLVERISYDGYGNSVGSTRTRYGFTGRERDSLTGLMYYRARFYDPQLGRFISQDPIGLIGGINLFAYVENNPLLFSDPSGQCPQDTKLAGQSTGGTLGNPFKSLTPFERKLNKCTKQLFGIELNSFTRSRKGHNGSFTGYGADAYSAGGSDTQITVVNEVNSYTSSQLGAMAGSALPPNSLAMGLTGSTPSGYTPYRNFTASNLTNSRAILATQVHELGNSLRRITRVTMDPNPEPVPSGDHDPGTRLEKCVFGGEVDWNGHLHHY